MRKDEIIQCKQIVKISGEISSPIQPNTGQNWPHRRRERAGRAHPEEARDEVEEGHPVEDQRARLAEDLKIYKFLQFFGGLVLGCIKTKFCKKLCV